MLGCGDQPGAARSNPARPEQQTLWFRIITSSRILKHHETLAVLLQKSLVVFIDSARRTAAARSFPCHGHTGSLPGETSCGFCSSRAARPCRAPPWQAGVLGHGSHVEKLLVLKPAGGKSIRQGFLGVSNRSSQSYGVPEPSCGLVFLNFNSY